MLNLSSKEAVLGDLKGNGYLLQRWLRITQRQSDDARAGEIIKD